MRTATHHLIHTATRRVLDSMPAVTRAGNSVRVGVDAHACRSDRRRVLRQTCRGTGRRHACVTHDLLRHDICWRTRSTAPQPGTGPPSIASRRPPGNSSGHVSRAVCQTHPGACRRDKRACVCRDSVGMASPAPVGLQAAAGARCASGAWVFMPRIGPLCSFETPGLGRTTERLAKTPHPRLRGSDSDRRG